MPKYITKIEVEASSPEKVVEIGNLIQFAVTNINHDDLTKLLSKVKAKPEIVKTALKFI